MKLVLTNLFTNVENVDAKTSDWLYEYLSFPDSRAHFRRVYSGFSGDDHIRLYDAKQSRFQAGFTRRVFKEATQQGIPVQISDQRVQPCLPDPNVKLAWLRDYQLEAVDKSISRTRGLLWLPTGSGKCLKIGTKVIKFNGDLVNVEDIRTGDLLLGPDSSPRKVLSTTRAKGELYQITPIKGDPWVCNDVHVLTLVHTETGDVIDIPLDEYLAKSKCWKHCHKLFQPESGVNFIACGEKIPVDPYFLGVWFGDGRRNLDQGVQISKPDPEIENLCKDVAKAHGLELRVDFYKNCPTYRIVAERGQKNILTNLLRSVVGNGERLPKSYLVESRDVRLQLLAGLLDTDGHLAPGYYEITQNRKLLAEDIAFLARSLGFRVTSKVKIVDNKNYYRLCILGNINTIPLRIPRKIAKPRQQKKNALRTGFSVQAVGDGEYAGFELDGDGRFLLGDFTVTHNTEIAVGLVLRVPTRWLFLVHKKDLLHQTVERFVKRAKGVLDLDPENDAATDDLSSPEALAAVGAGRIGDGEWIEGERFTVATFQTLYAALKDPSSANYSKAKKLLESVGGMIVDECHTLPADSFVKVANMTKNAYWRIGMSGTPLARGDKRSLMAIGCLGEIIYRLEPKTLIDRGLLAMPIIKMIEVNHTVNPETAPPTFQGVYGRYVVQSTRRNKALTEICKLADKPALLFVKEVKHGKILQDRLEREGIKSEFIWGQKETSQRKAAVERLLRGEIEVLICSVIFQEGTDIPELKSVIIASSGKSIIATLQRIGRGMRMSEGKGNTFEVWDIEDAGIDSLSKHSRARRKAYEKEGYKVGYAQISSLKSKVAQ